MKTYIQPFIISPESSILETLKRLNDLSSSRIMTLIVAEADNKMVGTITDGDIRRALIKHIPLDCAIRGVCNTNYSCIQSADDALKIKEYKIKGLKLLPVVDEAGYLVDALDLYHYRTMLPVDAVLMAGGRGERLRPMTLTTPKPLLEVEGKAIIDYNIEALQKFGVENITVTVNYLAEQIEAHFSKPLSNGVKVNCVREPQFLGTMGSVKLVGNWRHDTVLVMNSDLFTNADFEDFFLHFKEFDADMSIAAIPYSISVPYGVFDIEGDRNIVGIKEKPSYHLYANAGIYLVKREVLDLIPADEVFNATDLMEKLISANRKVIRFPLNGYWIDIGKPEDFKKVQELAKHTK